MKQCREEIREKLYERLNKVVKAGSLQVESKSDSSPVTEIDLFISQLVKSSLGAGQYGDYHFFSEEDQESFRFPCAVLDPIDGTRELVAGLPECSLSLALMNSPLLSDVSSKAWIFNPFTGFEIDSDQIFVQAPKRRTGILYGLVSNTESKKGYYASFNQSLINLSPRGSIAYKLGLLASGACDFVVTANPKNIWDIAAGSILLERRGIHLYQNGNRILELADKRYEGALIWCYPEHREQIEEALAPCYRR